MSTTGFFSVVAARPGFVKIRARRRRDLVDLLARFGSARQRRSIKRSMLTDYRYRVVVRSSTWARWAGVLALDATEYTNFKDAVKRTNPARARVYSGVWIECLKIEEEEKRPRPLFELYANCDVARGIR
jgi:hypothetical protein